MSIEDKHGEPHLDEPRKGPPSSSVKARDDRRSGPESPHDDHIKIIRAGADESQSDTRSTAAGARTT